MFSMPDCLPCVLNTVANVPINVSTSACDRHAAQRPQNARQEALVIQATTGLGVVILAESTLSFLGLGPGKAVSWGALLDQGTSVLLRFPHVALFSGGAIALTVLGFNLTGDWLRDRLDPRLR